MGCSACYNACKQGAISMNSDQKGFTYPKVNYNTCTKCLMCINVCPIINKKKVNRNNIKAYACTNKDNSVRINSSSGGIFTVIAEEILKHKGVVFGAKFSKDFKVVHSFLEDNQELSKFRGSKYVQSEIGYSYKAARNFLEQGRQVLFTGTPCQIAGLKSYLGKEYNNLLCQDIICQGVPSPTVWESYLACRTAEQGEQIKEISFRTKDEGWHNYKMNIKFQSGDVYLKSKNEDTYMKAFSKLLSLRPSCFKCKFKGEHRKSDITLADFWGIKNIEPSLNDNKGISLVLLNTEKGEIAFEQLKGLITYKEVNFTDSIKHNPMYGKSVPHSKLRDAFFSQLNTRDFDSLVNMYAKDTKYKILVRKLKVYIKNKLNI
ncbi:Coenzyme F420 hydrogenase/dehydrogenase, beta subunit C-terminal domain [Alkaliphilus sp. B6464]|nr:Coenzyme F420 hydrogenase/dehydrogenase, beta subunit C-terminal domain [Alkaliphilus sp. B6464]